MAKSKPVYVWVSSDEGDLKAVLIWAIKPEKQGSGWFIDSIDREQKIMARWVKSGECQKFELRRAK